MNCSFAFAGHQELDELLPEIFQILRSNMETIAPTGDSYEEDYAVWREYILPAMRDGGRRMVLMFCGGQLAGYFQYRTHDGIWTMEEIQIKKEYQGSGLFRELYRWLEYRLPAGLTAVEAYANQANLKSQGILKSMGLIRTGKNASGSSWLYRGSFALLWEKLRERQREI